MYLLNTNFVAELPEEFKRRKGSKNTKLRKDKGVKRVSNNPSKDVQESYLKSRTIRSNVSPYMEASKEARLWATLANDVSTTKRSSKSSNLRNTVKTAKDIKGLLS